MPLPAPNLDDRTFQDIVDEAKRMIPRFTPEWTNHNLADPGVAILELLAWMSEMVLFRVNQVPDRLFVHFLNLVGIEPFPPAVARAPITFWLTAPHHSTVTVPAGTQVSTAAQPDGHAATVFSTVQRLDIRPPVLSAAFTADAHSERLVDVTDDLRFPGTAVQCFTTQDEEGRLVAGDAVLLCYAAPLGGTALRLTVDCTAQGIGVDPSRPPLAWESWNGEAWIEADVHRDTTGGLNRPGEIVLMVPPEHEMLFLGSQGGYWLRVRLDAPRPGQPTYQASPMIDDLQSEVIGATVTAEHASFAPTEMLGRSDGSAGQEYRVGFPPVLPRRADETVRVTAPTGAEPWTEVEDFARSGPDDRHFVWDSASGAVRFGPRIRYPDGSIRQHGAIPADGGQIAVTSYRYGGGSAGNVGAGTLTELRSAVPFISGAVNRQPAVGGVDAETVAEAKARGPLTLRTGQRAVTADDFERLTLESSIEVARARCLSSANGRGPVRLLVVPHVRSDPRSHVLDDFALTPPLLRTITTYLEAHRLVGTAVEVGTPFYQGVSVAALLNAPPGRPVELVRQRAMDELVRYLNPVTGGADGAGWVFDADLNASAVAQLLETVEGVARVDEVQLFEYDLRTGRRIGMGRDLIRLNRHSLFLSGPHRVVVR